ncbi:MAG TPA: serine--tRNA ligase [Candidatus Marinimicrobia bacterium]|jgi:seryl-tRNA synthetase|nr:serine--tRNA ligase [Candidatus Neomarinimicrobiota bacterium]HBN45399.1 serine--tRNA ligase [Candidatus Neomarinimicrobiota bacterium]HJL75566.1 serine--tRNA ligase [Candidatus Neomarinimicrobiota bacterium]HJM70186.1 serine--tRNA ligase [Candidatus Neomarinimicrobiota bacterium]|tara:strand:+ start:11138 stop:12406 length:1269 start_codon:yes stop_codon:yes gene_type:complete
MLSISRIRENPDAVQQAIAAKGEQINLKNLLELDRQHRAIQTEVNDLRAERNRVSEKIAATKRSGGDDKEAIAAMRDVGDKIKALEEKSAGIDKEIQSALEIIPNIPHTSVPIGTHEKDNVVVKEWGDKPVFDYDIKDHMELGTNLNLLDFERAAKISGSAFPLYTGMGAKLERALINYMLDVHINEHGYTEIFPPFLTRGESPFTCGQLPKFADDMYHTEKDQLYLIPTAEVPVTNIHADEILDEEVLPINYTAYSACFRREAGSYGKETRGLLRVHQFNKVEMVKFVTPESSYDELEDLLANAEAILQALGLHYRVLELCTGDLSFSAAKCYDIEVWSPAEQQWLEVSSCSNFEDFQARRGNIRYRRTSDNKTDYVHTLNGSGVATPRLMIALLESYQTPDGKVIIPKCLQPYVGTEVLS